jgi:amidase
MELLWAGADAQARALRAGEITAPDLLEAVLARAGEVDKKLNAFRVLWADSARAAAVEAQRRLDAGERTPLLGVPIALKDDLDVAGDAVGKGGRPQHEPAERDSEVVARLRAAGAVFVGRTRLPDRGLWPFTETLTHGATRNPWDPARTPGGSSGGSGAVIGAGVVGAATGSDGGGSIRIPAAACGIFGLKTTRGLVPTEPFSDWWHGLTVIGPLGRRVADAAAMLDVIAGDGGYRAAVDTEPGPLRIALSWQTPLGPAPMDRQRRAAVRQTAQRLRELGHEVTVAAPKLGARPLSQFLVRFLVSTAEDVRELPHPEWVEPRTRGVARLGERLPAGALARMDAGMAELDDRVADFFGRYDVVLQPAQHWRQARIGRYQGKGATATMAGCSTEISYFPTWNVLGLPVAAVPVGRDDTGLPMGVQLAGPAGAEARLLSLAAQYERAHPWHQWRPES